MHQSGDDTRAASEGRRAARRAAPPNPARPYAPAAANQRAFLRAYTKLGTITHAARAAHLERPGAGARPRGPRTPRAHVTPDARPHGPPRPRPTGHGVTRRRGTEGPAPAIPVARASFRAGAHPGRPGPLEGAGRSQRVAVLCIQAAAKAAALRQDHAVRPALRDLHLRRALRLAYEERRAAGRGSPPPTGRPEIAGAFRCSAEDAYRKHLRRRQGSLRRGARVLGGRPPPASCLRGGRRRLPSPITPATGSFCSIRSSGKYPVAYTFASVEPPVRRWGTLF
jgi:hypothetical protein